MAIKVKTSVYQLRIEPELLAAFLAVAGLRDRSGALLIRDYMRSVVDGGEGATSIENVVAAPSRASKALPPVSSESLSSVVAAGGGAPRVEKVQRTSKKRRR